MSIRFVQRLVARSAGEVPAVRVSPMLSSDSVPIALPLSRSTHRDFVSTPSGTITRRHGMNPGLPARNASRRTASPLQTVSGIENSGAEIALEGERPEQSLALPAVPGPAANQRTSSSERPGSPESMHHEAHGLDVHLPAEPERKDKTPPGQAEERRNTSLLPGNAVLPEVTAKETSERKDISAGEMGRTVQSTKATETVPALPEGTSPDSSRPQSAGPALAQAATHDVARGMPDDVHTRDGASEISLHNAEDVFVQAVHPSDEGRPGASRSPNDQSGPQAAPPSRAAFAPASEPDKREGETPSSSVSRTVDPVNTPMTKSREAVQEAVSAGKKDVPVREERTAVPSLSHSPFSAGARQESRKQSFPALIGATEEPSVVVRIGRIEVRTATPPPAPPVSGARRGPTLSLDDYLRQREGKR